MLSNVVAADCKDGREVKALAKKGWGHEWVPSPMAPQCLWVWQSFYNPRVGWVVTENAESKLAGWTKQNFEFLSVALSQYIRRRRIKEDIWLQLQASTHAWAHTYVYTHPHVPTPTCTQTYMCTHLHTCTHTYTHTCASKHVCTQEHTPHKHIHEKHEGKGDSSNMQICGSLSEKDGKYSMPGTRPHVSHSSHTRTEAALGPRIISQSQLYKHVWTSYN